MARLEVLRASGLVVGGGAADGGTRTSKESPAFRPAGTATESTRPVDVLMRSTSPALPSAGTQRRMVLPLPDPRPLLSRPVGGGDERFARAGRFLAVNSVLSIKQLLDEEFPSSGIVRLQCECAMSPRTVSSFSVCYARLTHALEFDALFLPGKRREEQQKNLCELQNF